MLLPVRPGRPKCAPSHRPVSGHRLQPYRNINSLENAYQNADFLKINPQHTVPCLDDNGDVLADSHAICTYLVSKYGAGDDDLAALCPSEPFQRALLDHRLHFNNGTLFGRFYKLCAPVFRGTASSGLDKGHFKCLLEALDILEALLEQQDAWLVGDRLTVADLCCVSTVAPIFKMLPVEKINYPRIVEWLERLNELPYYDEVMGQYLINVNEVFVNKLNEASK